MTWLTTSSGHRFPLLDPTPADVRPRDLEALSRLCRFGGHVEHFYSVAQHSVLVSNLVDDLGGDLEARRWGLLHDAAEAYLGDVITPLKRLLPRYEELEAGVLRAVAGRFGLALPVPAVVKDADAIALALEAEWLCHGAGHRHALVVPQRAVDPRISPDSLRLAHYRDALGPADAWAAFLEEADALGGTWFR